MSQRASSRAIRLGYNQEWDNYYFAKNRREFTELTKKVKVNRDFFYSRWKRNIARLKIELSGDYLSFKIYVNETSAILGENNQNSEKVLQSLYKVIKDDQIKVDLDLVKIKNPYLNSQLISNMLAEQLEKRIHSRRALSFFIEKASAELEVRGIRIGVKGILDGVAMAQKRGTTRGKMRLSTKDSWIEEGEETAVTTRGTIGVKVSIYKGKLHPYKN